MLKAIPLGARLMTIPNAAQTVRQATPAIQAATLTRIEGTCTKDHLLIWSVGQWRLISPGDPSPPTCARTIDTTWYDVAESSLYGETPIYIGPFPISQPLISEPHAVTSPDQTEITPYFDPNQILKAWCPQIANMLAAASTAYGYDTLVNPYDGSNNIARGWPGLPPFSTDPNSLFAKTNQAWDGSRFTDRNGATWWVGKDEAGNSCTYVVHPNGDSPSDVKTYKCYSDYDWALYLGLKTRGQLQALFGSPQDVVGELKPDLMTQWTCDIMDSTCTNQYPIAKWNHPATITYTPVGSMNPDPNHSVSGTEVWGLWCKLALPDSGPGQAFGFWNPTLQRPQPYVLYVGFGKIPQEPWYNQVLDALWFVPSLIAQGLNAVAQGTIALGTAVISAIQNLVCANPQAALQASSKGGGYAIAGTSAVALTCPNTSVDCTQPANAALAACQPPGSAIPWWVWAAGGALIIVIIANSKSSSKPAERP